MREIDAPLDAVALRVDPDQAAASVVRDPGLAEGERDPVRLLANARPRFRALAEAVEARLGDEQISDLRGSLGELRAAIEAELGVRPRVD